MTVGPNYRDPDHTFLWCDACTSLGVRLEPFDVQVSRDGEMRDESVGEYLSPIEARTKAAVFGWLVNAETLIGDRRFFRDYCPRCRALWVVA